MAGESPAELESGPAAAQPGEPGSGPAALRLVIVTDSDSGPDPDSAGRAKWPNSESVEFRVR